MEQPSVFSWYALHALSTPVTIVRCLSLSVHEQEVGTQEAPGAGTPADRGHGRAREEQEQGRGTGTGAGAVGSGASPGWVELGLFVGAGPEWSGGCQCPEVE